MTKRLGSLVIVAVGLLGQPVAASGLDGVWLHQDGRSKVRFTPCGGAMCGDISWLKGPSEMASVGQRIFMDMRPDGGGYKGSAYNPEDKRTYSGSITVSGNTMVTKGCALGGMICKSVRWTRSN